MRNNDKLSYTFVILFLISICGTLLLSACGSDSSTGSEGYTIIVPGDTDFTLVSPGGSVAYIDQIVYVKNADGAVANGVNVKFIETGSGLGSFYTDNGFGTPIAASPFTETTDDNGKILLNYDSSTFASISGDQTFTFGYRAQSGIVETSHTDVVTVEGL